MISCVVRLYKPRQDVEMGSARNACWIICMYISFPLATAVWLHVIQVDGSAGRWAAYGIDIRS
jgi:hypothetical protein